MSTAPSPQHLTSRLSLIIILLALMVLIILGRLFHLQIHIADIFLIRSKKNFLRIEKITSPRGAILDCHGRPLATNRPVTTIYWNGTGKNKFDEQQESLIRLLELVLAKDLFLDKDLLYAETHYKRYPLAHDIPFELLSKLIEQYPSNRNLLFSTHFKRFYPYQSLACHTLGYLGSMTTETSGQMGLEKICEAGLKGEPGKRMRTVNSRGHLLAEQEVQEARSGENLLTTLDLDLQRIAEEIFPTEYAGVILGMDPQNGALRIIVSRPTFDPNLFVDPIKPDDWKNLQNEKNPFINRAFFSHYPPASLFKLISISAALEHNMTTPDTIWHCHGYTMFAGRSYGCHKKTGHGAITTAQAIEYSCNIPFFEMGKRIKIDTIAEYAYRFGLGSTTKTVFAEKHGLIPTAQWKRITKQEPWWPGETLSAMIGQSYLLVTPIQVACMISGICEGYLVKPRILETETIESRPLALQQETRDFLKRSMARVVKRGTGNSRQLDDIEIYAKTGTGQTSALSKQHDGEKFQAHAWFVIYIKYKEHAPITLIILLEHACTSAVARSVARSFLTRYCRLLDQGKLMS